MLRKGWRAFVRRSRTLLLSEETTGPPPKKVLVEMERAVAALTADLPGLPARVSGFEVGADYVSLSLSGHDDRGKLWSEHIRIAPDVKGRPTAFLATPHVFVDRAGKRTGPKMLGNLCRLAESLDVTCVQAWASMSMGRALTMYGFVPTQAVWPGLKRRLVPIVHEEFSPRAVAASLVAAIERDGPRSVWMFVPGPAQDGSSGPPLGISYEDACKAIFIRLSWEAELDFRDDECRARYEWAAARLAANEAAAHSGRRPP